MLAGVGELISGSGGSSVDAWWEKALARAPSTGSNVDRAALLLMLAKKKVRLGDEREADRLLAEAERELVNIPGQALSAEIDLQRGFIRYHDNCKEAISWYERTAALAPEQSATKLLALDYKARCEAAIGNITEADSAVAAAEKIFAGNFTLDEYKNAIHIATKGILELTKGNCKIAATLLVKAQKIDEKLYGEDSPEYAGMFFQLARAATCEGDLKTAEDLLAGC